MTAGHLDSRPLLGIALGSSGYACFALQDAMVKWLVADYGVAEILFFRSLVIAVIAGLLVRYRGHPSILKSRQRGMMVLRAALMLTAWLLFYNAARYMGLAELTTLYFSAPIMVMFLAILVLKERISAGRWLACVVGFLGVCVAANPTQSPSLLPAAMCILAGFCWAWSTIFVRLVSRTESSLNQMLATSLLFAIACAVSFLWQWATPDAAGWTLLLLLGLISALGQFLLYEGFRHASASVLAPVEYSGLIWAFFYGYAIWAEVPTLHVVAGALLIVASSLVLVFWERHGAASRSRQAA